MSTSTRSIRIPKLAKTKPYVSTVMLITAFPTGRWFTGAACHLDLTRPTFDRRCKALGIEQKVTGRSNQFRVSESKKESLLAQATVKTKRKEKSKASKKAEEIKANFELGLLNLVLNA